MTGLGSLQTVLRVLRSRYSSPYCHVAEGILVHFIRPEARAIRVHNNKKTVLVTSKLNYIVNIVIVSRYNSKLSFSLRDCKIIFKRIFLN